MKAMKRARLGGLCLTLFCMTVVFGFGAVGSASARPTLLFLPKTEKFPYHLVGKGGASKLEGVGGVGIESPELHTLALILNSTLFNLRIEFLKTALLGGKCQTPGSAEGTVLINLLGHLGLIDPGLEPGVLLLLPKGFGFTCTNTAIGTVFELVRNSVIGLITAPKVGVETELLSIKFEQEKGKQRWTTFLLGNEQLTNQFEESSANEGAFEQSGQAAEATLHALPGQGTFRIILDP